MQQRIVLLLLIFAVVSTADAQPGPWPSVVEDLVLEPLAGDWHEVAAYGRWPHAQCTADTRFHWQVRDAGTIDVRRACTTATGEEVRLGRLRAADATARARLTARFAPAFFAWLPAVWTDHWVLATGNGKRWLLIGDRGRTRLSVLSRVAALDEASLARAIQQARGQGFDVDRLVSIPHRPPGTAVER